MIQQTITSLTKKCLFIGASFIIALLSIQCEGVKETDDRDDKKEAFSTVELEYFTFDGLELITHKNILLEHFGEPDKVSKLSHKSDTLVTLFFFEENTEIAFQQIKDSVFFTHLQFTDSSNFSFKNEYATFSRNIKFDPFKVSFYNSVQNHSMHDGRKVLTLKVIDREKSWIRLEFKNDRLWMVAFDTPFPK